MYQPERTPVGVSVAHWRSWQHAWRSVSPNVWFLGLTSLLTDVSSEMVASVLPAYFVLHLGLSPLAFGALDGLYNGVTALVRWASGLAADRWRRHKEVALAGYATSAVSKIGLLAAGSALPNLTVALVADRLGKGIRTIPRDALISLSGPQNRLAYSFGVHRALDAAGALIGPLVALALLGFVPGAFDVLLVTSFCIAIVGLGVLALFVENVRPAESDGPNQHETIVQSVAGLFAARQFRVVLTIASTLALFTTSDAFVYLLLQERAGFEAAVFPVLYIGTAASYLMLAAPAGRLADRIGRRAMFLIGYGMLLAVYALLLVQSADRGYLFLAVIALGAYYAATDGVLMAICSGVLPERLRGTGFALITTATSCSRLAASIAFGWMWTTWNAQIAVITFSVALACCMPVAALTLGLRDERP